MILTGHMDTVYAQGHPFQSCTWLDADRLRNDMEADWIVDHLATSLELADHMSLIGTPSFIAGDEAVFGQKSLQDLQGLVARGRETLR